MVSNYIFQVAGDLYCYGFLKVKLTQKNKRNELVLQLVSNPQPLG